MVLHIGKGTDACCHKHCRG